MIIERKYQTLNLMKNAYVGMRDHARYEILQRSPIKANYRIYDWCTWRKGGVCSLYTYTHAHHASMRQCFRFGMGSLSYAVDPLNNSYYIEWKGTGEGEQYTANLDFCVMLQYCRCSS